MTPDQIHAALRERFGEAIGDWTQPEVGDSFILVSAEALKKVCQFLRDDPQMRFDYLRLLTAVDHGENLSSVYHLYSYEHLHGVVLRVDVPRNEPCVASVVDLWPAADWHEREAFDMMGIVYEGHPDLKRILLPEDWDGFPLRKDYQSPEEYHGIPGN